MDGKLDGVNQLCQLAASILVSLLRFSRYLQLTVSCNKLLSLSLSTIITTQVCFQSHVTNTMNRPNLILIVNENVYVNLNY